MPVVLFELTGVGCPQGSELCDDESSAWFCVCCSFASCCDTGVIGLNVEVGLGT